MSFRHSLLECTDKSLIVCAGPAAPGVPRPSSFDSRVEQTPFCHITAPSLPPRTEPHNCPRVLWGSPQRLFLAKGVRGTVGPSQAPTFASPRPVLRRLGYSSGPPHGFPVSCFWRMQATTVKREAATVLSFFPGNFFSEATE